jgi:hypothetical protein
MKIKTIAKAISWPIRMLMRYPLMAFGLSGLILSLHVVIKMCDPRYTATLGWAKDTPITVGAIAIVLCTVFVVITLISWADATERPAPSLERVAERAPENGAHKPPADVSKNMSRWLETFDELSAEQAQALYTILGGDDELDFRDEDAVHEVIDRMWKVITPVELPQFTRALRILAGLPLRQLGERNGYLNPAGSPLPQIDDHDG